ncbi:MAG: carbohydrate-binding protein [Bacteroidota bacterium]
MRGYILLAAIAALAAGAAAQTELQAEDAILFGAYARSDHAGYTGTGYADVVDTYVESTGGFMEFVFRRASAATDTVTVYYANGASTRSFALKLNDVSAGTISLPSTGGWSTWSSQKAVLGLQAGTNRLRFTTTTKAVYPNVDRIVIGGQTATPMFRLILGKSGNGSVAASPSATYHDAGATVELSAVPSGSSFFKRWMGAGDSPASPFVLTMNAHANVVGVFLDTTGTGGFVVEPSPAAFASVNALGTNGTTGGAGGDTLTVYTGDELWNTLLLRRDPDGTLGLCPLTIFIPGILSPGPVIGGDEMLDLKDASDISLVGVGSDATITGFGVNIVRSSNIIVRNIRFASCPDDGIAVQADDTEATGHHIWIDHCTFTDTPPPGYPAGSTPDGALDITHTASYVTVSWCLFTKHDKTCLLGHSDSQTSDAAMKISYHHNYYDSTAQRNPRVRFAKTHVYNNYYRRNALYGVSSNLEADVLVEGCYFTDVAIPTETSRDGSPPGDLVERNNIFVNCGTPGTRGTAFDPSAYYSYTLDSAGTIPAKVTAYSGSGRHDFSHGGSAATYTLTVNAVNGTVTRIPDEPSYPFGTAVQLTAHPSPGYHFVRWTGDVPPSQAFTNPVTITMDGHKTVTALFTNVLHTLSVTASNGTVTKNPDLSSYPEGTQVLLTPNPSPGYFFVRWTGDVGAGHEADNPLTLLMDTDKSLTAHFSNAVFTLTTNAVHGSVVRSPNQALFDSGAVVQLTAVPDTGYHFTGWSGDTSGTANPVTLIMNSHKTVTATFAVNQYTLTVQALHGTVTRDPDQPLYDHGTSVQLTAVPDGGYLFTGWSGDASGNANPLALLMNGNKSVTAAFTSVGSIVQSNGTGGGLWNSSSTWLGGVVPGPGHSAVIQGSDSVYVSSAASCSTLNVTPGGRLAAAAALSVAGAFDLDAGAFFYYSSSPSLTLPGGTATLHPASTVVFNTASTSSGTITGGSYGNLIIARDGNLTPDAPLTVEGNLTLNNSSGTKVFRGTSSSTSRVNTVRGNVTINGGTLSSMDNGGGGASGVWNIEGDVLVTGTTNSRLSCFTTGGAPGSSGVFNIGGSLTIAGGRLAYASNNSTSGTGIVNLGGNLSVAPGSSITDNGSAGPFAFNFAGTTLQTVALGMNFSMATNMYDTVRAGSSAVFENGPFTWGSTGGALSAFVVEGSLELKDSSALTGPGSFLLAPGAMLKVGAPAGVTASGASGNIRVGGTRSYSTEARYGYTGSVPQATGDGLPPEAADMLVANPQGVTLTSPVTVNGTLTLFTGDLDLNGNTVTLGPAGLLNETAGNTVTGSSGVITATRTLTAPSAGTDIAGLGIRIGSAGNPGITVISRGHAVHPGAGGGSVSRFFDLAPANNTGLDATLVFSYDESELNGIPEGALALFRSTDGGSSWEQRGGSPDPGANRLTLTGVDELSRWTAGEGPPAAVLFVTPPALDFGAVGAGGSRTDSVHLVSVGLLTLQVDSIRAAGSGFSAQAAVPDSLPTGDSLSVRVTFSPPGTGAYSGALIIFTNAAGSPDTVILTGTGGSSTVTLPVPLEAGWQMISNPVLTASDSVAQLFPMANPVYAFSFHPLSGYEREFVMENGTGYWGKFPSDTAASLTGTYIGMDSTGVAAGWNLIGSVSAGVDTGDVASVPPGIRTGAFYGFDGTYQAVSLLEPGRAYWVKTSAPGTLILSPSRKEGAGRALHGRMPAKGRGE